MINRVFFSRPMIWLALTSVSLAWACGDSGPSALQTTPGSVESSSVSIALAHVQSREVTTERVATLTRSVNFIWPYQGRISSYFGPGHPLGIDIAVDGADEVPIRASANGWVVFAGGDACCEYGYYVVLDHPAGRSTLYGHLSRYVVNEGQKVAQGEVIGFSGMTGKTDGPHLHFELRQGDQLVDPLRFLAKQAEVLTPEDTEACGGTTSTLAPDSLTVLQFHARSLPKERLLKASLVPEPGGAHLDITDNRPFEPLVVSFEEPPLDVAAGQTIERKLLLSFGAADSTRTEVACSFVTRMNLTLPNVPALQSQTDRTTSPINATTVPPFTPTPPRNRPVSAAIQMPTPIPTATPRALYSVATPIRPAASAQTSGTDRQNVKPPTVAPTRSGPKHFGTN